MKNCKTHLTHLAHATHATHVTDITVWSLLFGALLLCSSAWALDPSKPPGQNFDLSHWYLQLPTFDGILTGTNGSVDSFSTAQLTSGAHQCLFLHRSGWRDDLLGAG